MTIEGLNRLSKKLKVTIPAVAHEAVQKALEASADEAVSTMKRLAPLDTGDLQMSISWTWGDAPKGAIVLARSNRARRDGARITIFAGGKDAYYARFVEFGTNAHIAGGKFAGALIPAIPAQPFFFPGWRLVRRKVKGRVTREITKQMKRLVVR